MEIQERENGTENIGHGRWLRFTMGVVLAMLVMLGELVIWMDPFFHYHEPLEQLAYPTDSERYQNDGISRNFTYDAVLTDTLMVENLKASRFDSLFGVTSVKTPYAGGYYEEVGQVVRRTLAYSPQMRVVCRGLDRSFLFYPKDQRNPTALLPEYLTDGNLFNDVNYIFSREAIFGTIPGAFARTKAGGRTTTFDEYIHWAPERGRGREAILKAYDREPRKMKTVPFTEEDRRTVMENLEQNMLATARVNSQVTFYYFIPPYSISWQDSELMAKGEFEWQTEGYRLMTRVLLECKNICLLTFDDQFDITCNLDHYADAIHYSEDIGDQLLERMAAGEHMLTDNTVDFYFDKITDFYVNHDYDSIYEWWDFRKDLLSIITEKENGHENLQVRRNDVRWMYESD